MDDGSRVCRRPTRDGRRMYYDSNTLSEVPTSLDVNPANATTTFNSEGPPRDRLPAALRVRDRLRDVDELPSMLTRLVPLPASTFTTDPPDDQTDIYTGASSAARRRRREDDEGTEPHLRRRFGAGYRLANRARRMLADREEDEESDEMAHSDRDTRRDGLVFDVVESEDEGIATIAWEEQLHITADDLARFPDN